MISRTPQGSGFNTPFREWWRPSPPLSWLYLPLEGSHPLFSQIEKKSEGGRVLISLWGKPPISSNLIPLVHPLECTFRRRGVFHILPAAWICSLVPRRSTMPSDRISSAARTADWSPIRPSNKLPSIRERSTSCRSGTSPGKFSPWVVNFFTKLCFVLCAVSAFT